MVDEWQYLEVEEPPKCLAGMFEAHHYSELPAYWMQCFKFPWRLSVKIDAGEGRQYEWHGILTTRPSESDIRNWSYMAWLRMKDKPGVREYIDRIESEAINA